MGSVESPVCIKCGGSGWYVAFEGEPPQRLGRACACRQDRLREERLKAAEIPERYRHCELAKFAVSFQNPSLARAKKIAQEFVDAYPAVEADMGLIFVGPTGVGKTHLAVAILAEVIRKGYAGLFCSFSELLMRIQTSFRPAAGFSQEDVLQPYVEADLLVLDELGASKPSAWVRDILYYLLNSRYNREALTMITTNYEDEAPPGERETLADRIGERLRSRLYEMCRLVPMKGQDYRKEVIAASVRP